MIPLTDAERAIYYPADRRFRIWIRPSVLILLAVLVRAMLPDQVGVTIAAKQGPIFLSFSRIGFWTCVWAAVTVTVLVVIRSMVGDFGSSSVR